MEKRATTILLVLIFFVGLSVLLYPAISNYWNSKTQSYAIVDYEHILSSLNTEDYTPLFDAADDYNERLRAIDFPLGNYAQVEGYHDALNVTGTGVMGYVTIEKIGIELPVYHGTGDEVLSRAAGHVEGTSLPVGGTSTHSVISAHRGLPSSRLFTDLDELEVGDRFTITILDRVLTYEVDRISIVEPHEIETLYVVEGEDHCTLLTCTPYGINTHRLLVRGTRTETIVERRIYVATEAFRLDTVLVASLVAVPILLLLLVGLLVKYRKKPDIRRDFLDKL